MAVQSEARSRFVPAVAGAGETFRKEAGRVLPTYWPDVRPAFFILDKILHGGPGV